MTETQWQRQCVLCAARGKTRRLETGHCCVECAAWLTTQVAEIARLAADAAAWVTPGSTAGGGGHSVPSSRPPLNCDAVQPELTLVPQFPGQQNPPTVLEVLELAEREVREARGMAPYGPASHARASGLYAGTDVTLIGCVTFLGRQVAWMTTEPTFGLEDFADSIRGCVRVLRRFDRNAEDMGQMVKCPTLHKDEGECGYRLQYRSMEEQVTCRRCGVTRDVPQLLMAADADNAWVDGEALAQRFGIDDSTIRKWARHDKVQRQGQRYRYGDVRVAVENMRRGAVAG